MANAEDKRLAYQAGRTAFETEPPERRHPDACPFDPRDEPDERAEWLRGFAEAMDELPDPAALRRAVTAARKEAGQ